MLQAGSAFEKKSEKRGECKVNGYLLIIGRLGLRAESKGNGRSSKLPVSSKNEVRSSLEEKVEVRDLTIRGEYRIPRSSLREESVRIREYRKRSTGITTARGGE